MSMNSWVNVQEMWASTVQSMLSCSPFLSSLKNVTATYSFSRKKVKWTRHHVSKSKYHQRLCRKMGGHTNYLGIRSVKGWERWRKCRYKESNQLFRLRRLIFLKINYIFENGALNSGSVFLVPSLLSLCIIPKKHSPLWQQSKSLQQHFLCLYSVLFKSYKHYLWVLERADEALLLRALISKIFLENRLAV